MHQRRKDQFRHHLQDRSQFQLTCRLCCDPTYWRLLTTKLIDELNQDCSGQSILFPGRIEEWSETRSCWKGSPCRDARCDYRHGLANKKLTMKKIREVVEKLPKDLNSITWCFCVTFPIVANRLVTVGIRELRCRHRLLYYVSWMVDPPLLDIPPQSWIRHVFRLLSIRFYLPCPIDALVSMLI